MDKHGREQKQTENKGNKKALIIELENWLHWLTYKDRRKQYNNRKAESIVNLLEELDPTAIDRTKYNPQLGMKRLMERCEKEKLVRAVEENSFKKNKFTFFHRNKGIIGAAAAVLVVCMVFWGTSSSTMADLDTGFFHWLKMGNTGQEVVLFPTQEAIQVDQSYNHLQYSDEELPQQYKDEMWIPETVGENWDLEFNDVILGDLCTILNRNYNNDSLDQKIQIQVKIYTNQLMFERKSYGDFTYLYEKEVAGTTMFYFEKKEVDDVNHVISFYQGTRCYSVLGDTAVEKIEEIATDYAYAILGNVN